jgi:hypothetical protein
MKAERPRFNGWVQVYGRPEALEIPSVPAL